MGKDNRGKELGKGLSQRKDGKYTARFTNKYGNRIQFYDEKLAVVRMWLNNAIYDDAHNITSLSSKMTISAWSDVWLNEYIKNSVEKTTYNSYVTTCKQINKVLGKIRLSEVKQITLQRFFNEIAIEYKKGTIKLIVVVLKAMITQAMNNGYLTDNPIKGLKLPVNLEKKLQRVLSIGEQKLFIQYLRSNYHYAIVQTCIMTGLRIGEVMALTWDDIDFEKNCIHVNKSISYNNFNGENCTFFVKPPKTKSSIRCIPIKAELKLILQNHLNNQIILKESSMWCPINEFTNLVFTTKTGAPFTQAQIFNCLTAVVKKINKEEKTKAIEENRIFDEFLPVHPHSLRHTFATRCFEAGMSPKTVQYLMGHSSINMTMDLYTHVTEEHKKDEFERVIMIV
ncbi:MAG: tyrosine-type recombinase/integrase [Lachnospiraceae bacterium]|nr:tyrosine-type recombinase/integrase [Lachnospiraceae bacterium]